MREQAVTACCMGCGIPWGMGQGVHYSDCPRLREEMQPLTTNDVRRIVREEPASLIPQHQNI